MLDENVKHWRIKNKKKEECNKEKTIRAKRVSVSFVIISRALISSRNKSGMARGIYGTKRHVMKCVRVQAWCAAGATIGDGQEQRLCTFERVQSWNSAVIPATFVFAHLISTLRFILRFFRGIWFFRTNCYEVGDRNRWINEAKGKKRMKRLQGN